MRQAIDEGLRVQWWTLNRKRNLQLLWDEPQFKAMMEEIEFENRMLKDYIQGG